MNESHVGIGRLFVIWIFLLAGTAASLAAVLAIWTEQQLLDTSEWERSSARLLADNDVRGAVAREVVGFLRVRGAEIEAASGFDLGLANLNVREVDDFLSSAPAAALFGEANGQAHAALVSALEDDRQGTVAIDLGPLATSFARQLGLPQEAGPIEAEVVLVNAGDLADARRPVRTATRVNPSWFFAAALAFYALAILLARSAYARALVSIGACLALAGGILLAARSLVGAEILDSFVTEASYRPAIRRAWFMETSMIRSAALLLFAMAAATVVAGAVSALVRRR